MKTIATTLILGTTLLTGACAAGQTLEASSDVAPSTQPAQTARNDAGEPISRSRPHSKERFVETYDADGDGIVTYAEFEAERQAGYNLRDANRDGEVHEEEYVSEYEIRLKAQLEEQYNGQIDQAYVRFNVLDKDEDGNMTLSEFNASGASIFNTLDTNGDGTIDDAATETHY